MRTAAVTCLVLVTAPWLAATVSRAVARSSAVQKTVAVITGQAQELPSQTAELLFELDGYQVVGVSENRHIVGLTTQASFAEAVADVDRGMRAAGWEPQGRAQQGIASYVRPEGETENESKARSEAAGNISYALVVIQDVELTRSVVVQFA